MLFSLASFLAFCSSTIIFNTIEVFTYLKGAEFFWWKILFRDWYFIFEIY